MKAEDLLLTDAERKPILDDWAVHGGEPGNRLSDRLCRAQVGKVLAVLVAHFDTLKTEGGDYAANSISDIRGGVGLTWPPKEG